jgi:uroporphyrinogen-III synthase
VFQKWKWEEVDAVTVSSAQGLANLFEMLDPALLRAKPLFVPHPRIAEDARARAVQQVVTTGSSDEQMLDGLVAYFRSHD